MTDELIMLLSTDWFFPYWDEIGITIVDRKKIGIQLGCRELVKQILDDADNFFLIDFSEERKQETGSRFLALLRKWDADLEVGAARKEWANLSHEELTKSWACAHLNLKLSSGEISEGGPPLDFAIRTEVIRTWKAFELKPSRFRDVCLNSKTDWDIYTRRLLGKPHSLASQLRKVLLDHRFRAFWADLRDRLTPQQLQQLVSWYRAMIKSTFQQDGIDLLPPYMC